MMKEKLIVFLLFLLMYCCGPAEGGNNVSFEKDPDSIYVILFHLPQRCEYCDAVEMETRAVLAKDYKDRLDSGEIKFLQFDILSENGKKAAKYLRATGQNLYIVKGDSIADLSGPAFIFAHERPEKYHTILKQDLDKYLR